MKSDSTEKTRELGSKLAQSLTPGSIVALEGELGAGKTCFVQGMAKGLGVSERAFVRSPSFTLLNQYDGKITIYHFDFYRLDHVEELGDLGLEEYFDGDLPVNHGKNVLHRLDDSHLYTHVIQE